MTTVIDPSDYTKPALIALAKDAGVSTDGTKDDIAARLNDKAVDGVLTIAVPPAVDDSTEAEAATIAEASVDPAPGDAEAPTAPVEASAPEVGDEVAVKGERYRLDKVSGPIVLVSRETGPGHRQAHWVNVGDVEAIPAEPTA